MTPSGHWIAEIAWTDSKTRSHHESIYAAFAYANLLPRHGGVLTGPPKPRTGAPPALIVTRCPAPGRDECRECWLADVPF